MDRNWKKRGSIHFSSLIAGYSAGSRRQVLLVDVGLLGKRERIITTCFAARAAIAISVASGRSVVYYHPRTHN